MNILSREIQKRAGLIGTLVSVASQSIAEALSLSGLDWLFFDLEHSVMSLAEVQGMIQAMRGNCLSMIRVEEPSAVYVKKALDTGCTAIIVPQVNSVEIARAVVAAGKYPPFGNRSVGLGRALGYGLTLADSIRTANDETAIIVQIEYFEAVETVEEIAAVDGVDGLFIGPYDLSGSYGVPGQIGDARVRAAMDRVYAAGKAAGKPVGIFVGTAEAAKQELARGAQFVAVGSDVARLVGATMMMCEVARG